VDILDGNIGRMDPADNPNEKFGYTAFERWGYRQIIFFPENQEKTWLSMTQSFYWAGKHLVEGVVTGKLREDIEGRAALFLFRHYLELTLKEITVAARYLTTDGRLTNEEVKQIKTGHNLVSLWKSVLEEAKPKMPKDAPWENYDCEFAEACVKEFDAADTKGFAFRYEGEGGERAHIDFEQMLVSMDHVRQVLEGILTVLIETRGEIVDWLHELRSEAGW
jgi:hypothetical protein